MTKCPLGFGNRYGYTKFHCKCEECSKAHREYIRKWRNENKEKHLKHSRDWRANNPEKVKKYAKKYRNSDEFKKRQQERTDLINNIKLKSGCVDCGYNKHPSALHFDHIQNNKEFTISHNRYLDIEKILKEIEKCEVRCANCHAIKHAKNKEDKHGT